MDRENDDRNGILARECNSGHIQSLVNPPGNPKSKFWLNPGDTADADAWLGAATPTAGSWWLHWRDWLAARSGDQVEAQAALGNAGHPPLGPAPGSYVVGP